MASEKKFIAKALIDYDVATFLEKQLEKAGVSSVSIQKTPIATRILIDVRKPGMVVGKKGASIKELNELLTGQYGIE
ncbi:KH domain-containing protein, partial [Candidatus Micrarchaeota archaeon]|nr:KH domain-containing protein [Candidatus Micrarchaeota archaeon]